MTSECFSVPVLDPLEENVIREIERLREELRFQVAEPRRWLGRLRRMTLARAVQASTEIEGYHASLDDVAAVVDDVEPLDAADDTRSALAGYRDAMTYVLQMARDREPPALDAGLVRSLHFMMIRHDLARHPGRLRSGAAYVRNHATGETVYEAPPGDEVPRLVEAMLASIASDRGSALVRGAMAHLNLAMIHPFADGNGRMARCLQTLVLARERILSPDFSSIEEYLGRNTGAYYAVLAEVGRGSWNPGNDARPWVRFCLTAHLHQAQTLLRRVREAEELWVACAALAETHRVPERTVGALCDAAVGQRLRNATYRAVVRAADGAEISDLTASRDLKALVGARLLVPVGQTRGRYYVASEALAEVSQSIRGRRSPKDAREPFPDAGDDPPMPGQTEPTEAPGPAPP